jgi:uroporphyrinogen-III decarboxylase
MKWNREDFINYMSFGEARRDMLSETMGLLIGLDKEWAAQGAGPDELDLTGFCFDYVDALEVGNTGAIHLQKEEVIEETAEYIILRDTWGRMAKRVKATATIPMPFVYLVKTMDDWRKVKHMFEFSAERISMEQIEKAKALRSKGVLIRANIPGGFDLPRELMGEEHLCLSCYEDPELVHDIINTASDMSFRVIEEVSRHIGIDCLTVHEDMAGKSGPMFGPAQIEEFIRPHYRRVWDMLSSRGTKLFAQDSDGNMNPVIDAFIEAGVNVFYPCEPAAGMDIVALRKKYGRAFAMIGGIDKHVLRRSKEEIRKELEYKLQPLMRGGGICFALDHRIPNGTPLENYRYYVKTAREILGIADNEKGWARFIPY